MNSPLLEIETFRNHLDVLFLCLSLEIISFLVIFQTICKSDFESGVTAIPSKLSQLPCPSCHPPPKHFRACFSNHRVRLQLANLLPVSSKSSSSCLCVFATYYSFWLITGAQYIYFKLMNATPWKAMSFDYDNKRKPKSVSTESKMT